MVGALRRRIDSFKPVEIVIKATDNASKSLALISAKNIDVSKSAELMKNSFIAAGVAIGTFANQTFATLNNLIKLIERAYATLQTPIAQQIIQQFQEVGEGITTEMRPLTANIEALFTGLFGKQKGIAVGAALGSALGQELLGKVTTSINLIDQKILSLLSTIQSVPNTINSGLDIAGILPGYFAGFGEPVKLFKGLQQGVSGFANGLFTLTQELGQFSIGLSALQQLAQFGPFQALIQQNVELREQLLSTQTSLVATNNVLVGGVVVGNATAAIKALEGPVLNSIRQMRRDSLDLVGVTSKDLIGVYNILAGQISSVGGNLNDASNLTIDFAAALGTLKVPLDQARQEVNSILMGQISSDSYLAKSIGLTNQQVQIWRQQGVLVERLRGRLSAFTEGNAIAARSISGISSNIQEIFDEILRSAGEPLLDPIIDKLDIAYKYLQYNARAIQVYIGTLAKGLLEVGEIVSRIVGRIFAPTADIGGNLILLLMETLVKAARSAESAFNQLYPAIEPIINVLKALAANATTLTPFFGIFLKIQAAKLAVTGLSGSFEFLSKLLPGVGEVLEVVNIRSNPLIAQFTNLSSSLGRFGAAGLLAGKNLSSLPGAVSIVSQKLGIFGPILTPFIPGVATAGIAIAGLSSRFPPLADAIKTAVSNIPNLTKGVADFSEKSNFAGGILKSFAPQLKEVAEKSKQYGDASKLAADVNKKVGEVAKEAAKGVASQITNMALYSGAVFALFFALDNLILKNEGVKAIISEVGQQLQDIAEKLLKFLQTPAVSATIAIAALVVLIQTGLIPSMLKLAAAGATTLVTAFADQWRDLNIIFATVGETSARLSSNLLGLSAVRSVQAGADGASLAMANFAGRVGETKAAIAQVGIRKFAADLATTNTQATGAAFSLSTAWAGFKTAATSAFTAVMAGAKSMVTGLLSAFTALRGMVVSLATSFVTLGQAILATVRRSMLAARDAAIRMAGAFGLAVLQLRAMAINAARTGLATIVVAAGSAATAIDTMSVALTRARARIAIMGLGPYIKQLFATAAGSTAAGAGSQVMAAGLTQAAAAAKTLATTLGPIALAVVGIAAVTEVIRILHDEFFAGNKILKEYLKNLRDAEVELENASNRVKTPEADPTEGQYTRLLKTYKSIQADKNFVQKFFDNARTSYVEQGGGIGSKEALERLAQEEAGLIKLDDAERKVLQTFAGRDRDLNSRQVQVGELITTVDNRYQTRNLKIVGLKAEMDSLVKAFNSGQINEEQFQFRSGEVNKEIEKTSALLTQEISQLEKVEGPTTEQSKAITALTSRYEGLIDALGRVNSTAIEQKDIPRLGTQFEQLAQKAQQAEAAIKAAKGDPSVYADQAKSLISTTEQLLNANIITEEEALRRLALVANNTQLDAEVIGSAQQAITKTMEGQSQERISLIKSEQSQINQEIRNGTTGQVEGQQRLLELVKEEGTERLVVLQQQYERTKQLREQEQSSTLEQQEQMLNSLNVSLGQAGGAGTRTGAGIAAEIAIVEASIAANKSAFAQQASQSEKEYQGQRVTVENETAEQIAQSEETLYQTRLRLIDQAQQAALDVAKSAENATNIQNQRLLNSGRITQEQLAARRAQSSRETVQAELQEEQTKLAALEALPKLNDPEKENERQVQIRQSRLKTQELTLRLLETERQEVEENIKLLEKDLKDAAKGYSNELETQIQQLERQKNASDELTKSQELRAQIAEAENSLAQATSGLLSSEFDLLAQTTNSEYRKQQIAQVTATIKLQSARLQAEFARKSLEMEYEQNKLAREREVMENRIAVLRAEQAVRQGDAEVKVAQERFSKGLITEADLNEALIKQQGNVDRLGLERQSGALIRQQQAADERLFALRAQQGELEAKSAERQAQVGLAQALPPGLRERALNQVGEDIAQSFGYASRADLINSGTALARQTAQTEFGVGQGRGGLSAFDSSLEGLREQLTPSQYAAAVADSQSRFQSELGPQPFSSQQDQLLGRDAAAFQLPGIVLPENQRFRLSAGEAQGRDLGLPSLQPPAIAGGETDRLIAAFQQGGQPLAANFYITVPAGAGQEGQAVAEAVQREIEKVIDRSRQLIRSGSN